MTRTSTSENGRVTPPKVADDDVAAFTCEAADLQSFDRKERRHLVEKFDAEFTDLLLYVEQKLTNTKPDGEQRYIERIVTADGVRVMLDDILIEMFAVIRRRQFPATTAEDFDRFGLAELTAMIQAPKAG